MGLHITFEDNTIRLTSHEVVIEIVIPPLGFRCMEYLNVTSKV